MKVAISYILAFVAIISAITLYSIGMWRSENILVSAATFMLVLSFINYQNAKDLDE